MVSRDARLTILLSLYNKEIYKLAESHEQPSMDLGFACRENHSNRLQGLCMPSTIGRQNAKIRVE